MYEVINYAYDKTYNLYQVGTTYANNNSTSDTLVTYDTAVDLSKYNADKTHTITLAKYWFRTASDKYGYRDVILIDKSNFVLYHNKATYQTTTPSTSHYTDYRLELRKR